jgi:sn-glycerol 3-phosphate transport system permease protein
VTATTAPVRRRRRFSRRTRDMLLGYALVLPPLIVFGTFIFYPFVKNIWLGLYRTPPFPNLPRSYVGVSQYHDVLTSELFTNSLKVTLEFVLLTVPIGIALGLGLAVLAHQKLRGITVFRTIFSSTVVTSVAVASLISLTLLNPQIGLLNYWLGRTGSLSPLDDPKWALVAVAGVTIWQNLGLSFIIMSAGLQAVPDDLLEAATVDARRLEQLVGDRLQAGGHDDERQAEVLPDRHSGYRDERPLRLVERRQAAGAAEPVVEQSDLRVQQGERDQ